jgi:hypothetical protein
MAHMLGEMSSYYPMASYSWKHITSISPGKYQQLTCQLLNGYELMMIFSTTPYGNLFLIHASADGNIAYMSI